VEVASSAGESCHAFAFSTLADDDDAALRRIALDRSDLDGSDLAVRTAYFGPKGASRSGNL